MTTPSPPGSDGTGSEGTAAPARGARPALSPGDVVAGRYRLTRIVSDGVDAAGDPAPALLWQATDEVLARAVAVKVLPAGGRAGQAAAAPFLEAAGRASVLSHPGLARVYDAALEERPTQRADRTVDVAYVISEWVDGRSLAQVLATDGPVEPDAAVRMVQQAAEALAAAHARGVGHGRLHPGNLLVTPDGRLRITDAAVAAAAHRQPVPPAGDDGQVLADVAAADTRDLGAVLYALLTARWPGASTEQPAGGLPQAPRGAAAVYSPRQVRAGVPRALDALVVRVLDPARAPALSPIRTPLALAQALDEIELPAPEVQRTVAAHRARPTIPGWVRPAAPKLAAALLLVVVGVTMYHTGQRVGQLPRRPGALDALVAATPSAVPGRPAATKIDLRKPPITVRDYDPFSKDGTEQPSSVPNAYDEDLSTVWSTDGYKTATFGGLKPGVGLLVDLGVPTALSSVQVGMTAGGADLELRATNTLGQNADDFTVVARTKDSKQVADLKPGATPSRYWLVWFTSLPKADDGKYRLGVAELVLTRAG